MKKVLSVSILVIALGILLAACGSEDIVQTNSYGIPIFDGAIPDDGTYENLRLAVQNADQAAIPNLDIKVYAFTTKTSLDEIIAFYNDALPGWTFIDPIAQENVTILRWGNGEDEAIAIYFTPDASSMTNVVLVEHGTR